MRKIKPILLTGTFLFALVLAFALPVRADACDPNSSDTNILQICIDDLSKEISARSSAQAKNKADLQALQNQVARYSSQINDLESQIDLKQKAIGEQNKAFDSNLETLAEAVRSIYIRDQTAPTVATMMFGANLDEAIWRWGIYQTALQRDRESIVGVTEQLDSLRAQRAQLEAQQRQLAALKNQVDAQAETLAAEVAKVDAAFNQWQSQIAQLTARQQEILAAKTGLFSTSVGDVPPADDPAARPDYNPGFSPAFAAFSFGAPHFKGMSQYGAWGRAKAGQSAEQILSAYYGGGVQLNKGYSTSISITVQGYGTYNIEDYVKRIYEMPSSWTDNGRAALMAQAVAARSYALAYTNNGAGSICASESCQVFKLADKGGDWDAAVDATRGWVLTVGGRPFSAWYASTSGGYQESYSSQGYSTPGFWDTTCGSQGCWTNGAYEKMAGSPWFYKGWYRDRSGDSCGRSHPWLTSQEMADILNAWLVLFHGGGDSSRVTPLGACWGGNPYSMGDLQNIGGFTDVSGAKVVYSGGGYTDSVTFQTNKGSVTIPGSDFKKAFNLRAPGMISLKSGLFNIEEK